MMMCEVMTYDEKGAIDQERGEKKLAGCCIVVSHFLACYKQAVNVSAERRPSRR